MKPGLIRRIAGGSLVSAIALALAISAPAIMSTPAMAKGPSLKLSKPVQTILVDAQKAEKANELDKAKELLQQAEALPEKNNDDQFMISQMALGIGLKLQDNAMVEKALDSAIASGKLSEEDQVKYLRNSGALALQRNDYPKAIGSFEQVLAKTPTDTALMSDLAELYRRQGNSAKAIALLHQAIDTGAKANDGTTADESLYKRWLALAYDGKNSAETAAAGKALVSAYPSTSNWRDALVIYSEGAKLDDQGQLDVYRLQYALGALAGERDYIDYAETAIRRGFPGEAKRVLDTGVAKNALSSTNTNVREMNTQIGPLIRDDKSELPGLERQARSSANGKQAMGTADAYLGYGDYAKAADLYRTALAKGGIDADTANLRLGFALGNTGDAKGAKDAFGKVQGAKLAQLAQYYAIWLNQKNSPPRPAAPAAPATPAPAA